MKYGTSQWVSFFHGNTTTWLLTSNLRGKLTVDTRNSLSSVFSTMPAGESRRMTRFNPSQERFVNNVDARGTFLSRR